MLIVICTMHSGHRLIISLDYDHALLTRVANDHCSVDTPPLVTYVQGATARRRRHQFVPLFFEPNSTVLGFLVQVSLVPKEVVRWAADGRIAKGC